MARPDTILKLKAFLAKTPDVSSQAVDIRICVIAAIPAAAGRLRRIGGYATCALAGREPACAVWHT